MERACSIIAEACMPIFDKESASDECNMERKEAWKTLCTHYLETLDAAPKPPSPMTAEWRKACAQHTDRISRIRKQHPQVLELPTISSREERDDFVAAMRALSDAMGGGFTTACGGYAGSHFVQRPCLSPLSRSSAELHT